MKLLFKPDFAETAARWDAFWKSANRLPMIKIVVPKSNVVPVDPPPDLVECFDGTRYDAVIDQRLAWAETHEFLGDAMPFHRLEFAADNFAAYLGTDLRYAKEEMTSWAVPFVEDWDKVEIRFQKEGYWWRKTVEYVQMLRKRCDGKLLISLPTLSGNIDALAAIRGCENLLMDLVVCPEKIKKALQCVCRAHHEILEEYSKLMDFDAYGCINIWGAYLPKGRMCRPQCDASCMISPQMFQEFVVPCLESEVRDMDAGMYHLDGPDALKHLEAVCAIPRMEVIQFVKGAGNEDKDWDWVYEKIDRLGKGQYFYAATREFLLTSWLRFKSRKLYYALYDIADQQAADDVLAQLDNLNK
jgi:hypothetical protein